MKGAVKPVSSHTDRVVSSENTKDPATLVLQRLVPKEFEEEFVCRLNLTQPTVALNFLYYS
jgi:hypothetical protein